MRKPLLYEPLHVPKPLAPDLWRVDGPLVHMAALGAKVPFPTRMVVARLASGELWLWSPTELCDEVRRALDALGPVAHLVSPNKIHYEHIGAWQRAYPGAVAWACRGVRERARRQGIEVRFDRDLEDEAPAAWADEIDQLLFRGSRVLEEVCFFHRASRTLVLADLIENFERERVPRWLRILARLGGALHPDGRTPLDLRLSFLGRHEVARASLERMRGWRPERIVMAHGRVLEHDGARELERAFRWL